MGPHTIIDVRARGRRGREVSKEGNADGGPVLLYRASPDMNHGDAEGTVRK